MMVVLNWLKDNLFGQTALFLGLIVAVGMMLQKKKVGEILQGFITATLGYYIFNTGAGSIGGLAMVMGNLLRPTLGVEAGVNPFSSQTFIAMGYAIEYIAPRITICFIVSWMVHLLLVKLIKPLKVVYLTMHNILSFVATFYMFFYTIMDYRGMVLDLCAGFFTVLYITLTPMLVYKDCMKVTNNAFALGHFNQIGAWIASRLAPFCGNPEKENAETMQLPGWLRSISDGGLSVAVSLPIAYVFVWAIVVLVGNDAAIQLLHENAGSTNSLIYMVLTALQLAAAIYILLYGLRMFLGALLPAFQGISEKFIPDAVPGIDTVAFYAVSPNAVVITMLSYMVGAIFTTIICILLKTPILVIFQLASAFSESSAIGAIANSKGGWKACVASGLVIGILATVAAGFFAAGLGILDQGIAQANFDSCGYPSIIFYLFRMFK